MAWRLFDGADEAWDHLTAGLYGANLFQSSAWASHKRRLGWTTVRAAAFAGGGPAAAVQFLAKKYPLGASVLWARGGPVGDVEFWDADLRILLRRSLGAPIVYGRFCSYLPSSADAEVALRERGWRRPAAPLNNPLTFVLDVRDEAAVKASLSENWAHNLRRGLKRCVVRRWDGVAAADLAPLYEQMEAYKGLAAQQSRAELESLLVSLGSALILYRADDEKGAPIAFRACAVRGAQASDLLAATTVAGRKSYAAYALLWALIEAAREKGADAYDLGGADAETAKGVFDFKKGTGARPVSYIGEWDWASPGILRAPAGALAARKAGAL